MKKIEIRWVIIGVCGLYTGQWFRRSDAISDHTEALGRDWAYCYRKGDRAIKVKLIYKKNKEIK